MSTRSPEIITRASEVDEDLVPEPWDPRDSKGDRSLVAERERYRLQGVTDGQGAGIVPAYALDVAGTEAIPSKTKDGWTRGSAGRVLGPDGKYVSRGSDVPRKSFDGDEPGLLVEGASRTNQVAYSSDINPNDNWGGSNLGSVSNKTSILKNETAYEIEGATSNPSLVKQGSAGTYTSNDETALIILEKGTADKVRVRMTGGSSQFNIGGFNYDWSTDSGFLLGDGGEKEVNIRRFSGGPNGAPYIIAHFRYNASDVGENGSGRIFNIFVDENDNGNSTICHHAQIEEAPNASSPIVTQGSPVTRSADDYAIFEGGQPDWWNPNEGTLIVSWENLGFTFGASFDLIGSESGSFLGYIGTYSKLDYIDSSVNFLGINGSATGFETHVAALSMKPSENVIALNGSTDTGPHDGSLLNSTDMTLEHKAASYKKLLYTPRALPESTLNRITA